MARPVPTSGAERRRKMRMKWYDGKHWHWGNALSPKAKAKVYGHEFIVLVGSRDQRGLSFDEMECLPGHWREAESHASAVQAAEEEVEYWEPSSSADEER